MKLFPQGDRANVPRHSHSSQVRCIVTFLLIVTLMIAGFGIISSFGAHKAHAATTRTLAPTGSDFTQSVSGVSASQALVRFQPSDSTVNSVIVHYQFANTVQQNVNMTYDSGTGSWQYTISGLSLETVIYYSFTYQQNGIQYDTGSYSYTF